MLKQFYTALTCVEWVGAVGAIGEPNERWLPVHPDLQIAELDPWSRDPAVFTA